jgi:hypothetical protein
MYQRHENQHRATTCATNLPSPKPHWADSAMGCAQFCFTNPPKFRAAIEKIRSFRLMEKHTKLLI